MRKNIILIVAILLAALLSRWLFTIVTQGKIEKQKLSGQVPTVTVDTVGTENVIRSYEANARIMAKYRVEVLARISGYLTKSYFKEGDYVKKGQLLFEIEPQEYIYAVGKAKANLDNIKSQSDYYDKQLARYKELVNQDYIAKSEYDNILSQRNSFKAQVDSAENIYQDAQRNLGYTKVKAPVNGKVGIIDVTEGNFVSMNSGALTTINSSDPMYVTFPLNAKDFAELVRIDKNANVNRKVEFTFSSGQKYEFDGVQDFRDNKVDDTTGTITLRATFPNPKDELLQGDFGRIKIYSNLKDDVPVIPQTATMENQAGRFVYLLDENNIPKLVYIKTMGETGDNKWLVSEGLKAGDRIITAGLHKVIPGQEVRIVEKLADKEDIAQRKKDGVVGNIFKNIKKLLKSYKK